MNSVTTKSISDFYSLLSDKEIRVAKTMDFYAACLHSLPDTIAYIVVLYYSLPRWSNEQNLLRSRFRQFRAEAESRRIRIHGLHYKKDEQIYVQTIREKETPIIPAVGKKLDEPLREIYVV